METTFKGITVTSEMILKELHKFNHKYKDTNNYDNWLEKKSYKYAVQYDGKLYPCKYILSEATGIYIRDFNGGEETNRVFRQLAIRVIDKPSTI